MKKLLISIIIILFAGISVYAQNNQTIIIINKTGQAIKYVYLATADTGVWSNDYLQGKNLPNDWQVSPFLPVPLSKTNIYHICLKTANNVNYMRTFVQVQDKLQVVITAQDLYDN
jgi:hypothetical protein